MSDVDAPLAQPVIDIPQLQRMRTSIIAARRMISAEVLSGGKYGLWA
jgi:hypothetical protein